VTIRETEFAVLRQTIASRGTARAAVVVATIVAWGALASLQGLISDLPLLALIPLVVLGAGFEAAWGLHVGVERIGRFIQVTYESGEDGASWETTAMRASPGLPGSGADPLFTAVFAVASLVNLGAAFVAQPTPMEVVLLFACHALLWLRLARARILAGRQRRADLDAFTTARQSTQR
jgi:hypothetical protein